MNRQHPPAPLSSHALKEFREGRVRAARLLVSEAAPSPFSGKYREAALAALTRSQLWAMRIRLTRAIRAEASRGMIHHRCYDLARHVRLVQELRQVIDELSGREKSGAILRSDTTK